MSLSSVVISPCLDTKTTCVGWIVMFAMVCDTYADPRESEKNDPWTRDLTLTIILSNDPDPRPRSKSVRSLQTIRPESSSGTSGASVTATYVSQYFFPSISDIFETAGQVKVVDGPRVCDSTGWSEEIYTGERTFSNVLIKTFDCR